MDHYHEQVTMEGRGGMEPNEIDRILSTEEPLVPSSGFLTTVMERVREEVAAPAPIPFPWKRAVPGILLAVGVLGWGGFEVVRMALAAIRDISLPGAQNMTFKISGPVEDVGWVALALGISLAASLLSRRLAGRSGLL